MEEACHWEWALKVQKLNQAQCCSLPAAYGSRCRALSYLFSTMSACMLPCFGHDNNGLDLQTVSQPQLNVCLYKKLPWAGEMAQPLKVRLTTKNIKVALATGSLHSNETLRHCFWDGQSALSAILYLVCQYKDRNLRDTSMAKNIFNIKKSELNYQGLLPLAMMDSYTSL